jgi:hypothetical protein
MSIWATASFNFVVQAHRRAQSIKGTHGTSLARLLMATFNPTLPRGAPLGISGADTPTSDTFAAANGHCAHTSLCAKQSHLFICPAVAFAVSASVASAIMLWE